MLSYELNEKITKYLNQEISLPELEEWIVPRLPYFLQLPQSGDAEVISAFELGLAEMTNGTKTEAGFNELLTQALSEQVNIRYQLGDSRTETSSSNSFKKVSLKMSRSG